ncbi:lanthionine synthetase C family protein [Kitasatospora sp. NPDC059795]|uniref:lanthionine synthetase C family protein n=1 Tax=Kitasatospora sp. NPDC059795 TaxID=3346949 RepID=UPI00364EA134
MTAPAVAPGDPLLTTAEAERAAEAVLLTAERLADPARVAAVAGRPDNIEPIFGNPVWDPISLTHGHPGVALLHGELAWRDPDRAHAAHAHLAVALDEMPRRPSNGLNYGPAAIAAAVGVAAGPLGHYAGLRDRLTAWIAQDQQTRLAVHRQRRAEGLPGVPWAAYDVVNGLTGTGRLLLDAAHLDGDPRAAEALTATLRHLVALAEPLTVDGVTVPGWWVSPEFEPVDQDRRDYPRGDFNAGLAHGIAGPLMLLSLAERRGLGVPGGAAAAETVAEWLLGWTLHDGTGPYWPCRVSWDEQTAPVRPEAAFTRSAWCYGAPGVAVALHQAGLAFDRPHWRAAAVAGLRAVLARDEREWRLDGPTFCHGFGGLLQMLHRVAADSGDPVLRDGVRRMALRVLEFADPDAPFVFHHLTSDHPEGWRHATSHRRLDVAGVLEGAAGAALALLSVVPDALLGPQPLPEGPRAQWDRALLVA